MFDDLDSDPSELAARCREELRRQRIDKAYPCVACLQLAYQAFEALDGRSMAALDPLLRPPMMGMLKKRGARQHDAEDVYQDATLKLLKIIPAKKRFDPDFPTYPRFRGYFAKICASVWIDLLLSRSAARLVHQSDLSAGLRPPSEEERAADLERKRLIEEVMDLMDAAVKDPTEALVMELRFVYGYMPKKIAALHEDRFPGGATEVSKIIERVVKRMK